MLLDLINQANDIKKLSEEDYTALAQEIRDFLIHKISVSGGHLASNLGVVELTMAMHLVLNLPEDKIIWDVGHQSYTHKLLTGRRDGFDELRRYGGISGFPKRRESNCDAFDTGHSSTSKASQLGSQNAGKAIVMLLIQGIVPHQYQQGLGMWKQTVSKERKIPLFL